MKPTSGTTSALMSIVERSKKRTGRGHGSGKGKTAGRGTKGQKARGKIRHDFEGGQSPLTKRLPYLRGKGRNSGQNDKATPVDVSVLNALPKGTIVSLDNLKKYRMIDVGVRRVKILGKGTLTVSLSVVVPCSRGAASAITNAGGTVTHG